MFGFFEIIYAKLMQGSVKSVQRGVTAGAGNVTINAVNMNKSIILSKSKGSAGTVAATGNLSISGIPNPLIAYTNTATYAPGTNQTNPNATISVSGSVSGGTTNLTVKEYSATLTNSTTINCDGPVEWQVIEFV